LIFFLCSRNFFSLQRYSLQCFTQSGSLYTVFSKCHCHNQTQPLLIYRNFLRAKGYFFINLIGLAAGLVCTLLIYLWVRNEVNMNKFHEKDVRFYEVMENQKYADELMTTI